MFGLKAHKEYKLNFFTFFDITPKADETIVKNAFTNLKKQFNLSQSQSEKVYILGQPIYNKEIPEDVFIEHLEKILKQYHGKEIIYVKHRYENIPQKVAALLKERVEIYVNKYPIELDFLIKQEYPRYITGFFSTALYTLKQMFPESEVTLFHIDKKHFFKPERAEVVENYYTFFSDNGFKIVE
jgi:predicted Zn-dependent protease with MMP-like domain